MSVFQPTTTEEWMRDQTKRTNLNDRKGRGRIARGTDAARDAQYPPPTTQAEREALAGREWFDTTVGLNFRYYAAIGDTGVHKNLRAFAPGWYPADTHMPYVVVDKSIAQNVATTALTAITWSATASALDPFDMYNPAQNTRITFPFDGQWLINARYRTNGIVATTGYFYRTGAAYTRGTDSAIGGAGAATSLTFNFIMYGNVGDYAELFVQQVAATTQAVGLAQTFISATYQGPRAG